MVRGRIIRLWGGSRAEGCGAVYGPALQVTRPRYSGAAVQFLTPLRARSTGSGTYSWGPNPRHMGAGRGVASRRVGAATQFLVPLRARATGTP
eukprot:gene23330-biopygen4318